MYSPRINPSLIKELYQLKQQTSMPMTKLVNEAVIEYLRRTKDEETGLRKNSNKNSE
jgi:predicted choloylglycine hydrolase